MSFIQDLRNPSDFFASIQLIILVAFIFGLTPMRISGEIENRFLSFTKAGIFVTLFHMAMFATSFILAFLEGHSIVGYFFQSAVAQIGDSIQKAISLIGINYMYFKFFTNRQYLMNLCKYLFESDEMFQEIGVNFGYRKTTFLVNIELIFILFLNVAFIILANYIILLPNGIYPAYSVSYSFFTLPILISVIVVIFCVFATRLQKRFAVLNKVFIFFRFKF